MRTKILLGLALLGAFSGSAQQQTIVDLRTGVYDVPPPNAPWLMPIAAVDDTWKIYKYVNGSFQSILPAYVSNGHEYAFMPSCYPSQNSSNWSCTYQSIHPDVRVLAPDVKLADVPDPNYNPNSGPNIFDKGDIMNSAYDQYLYRTTFDFGKTCNSTIQSAYLHVRILAGDGITGFYINGKYVSLPNYTQMMGANPNLPYSDYRNIENALYAGNNYNNQFPYTSNSSNWPFSTYIPAYSVPIPASYFSNGSNTIIIAMNPSTTSPQKHTGALIIDAEIEINHTPGTAPYSVTPSGPVTLLHTQTQMQSVVLSASTSTPGIFMQLIPGFISGVGPTTISATYTPPSSTTLFVKVTQPSLGCVDLVKIPVNVRYLYSQNPNPIDVGKSTPLVLFGTPGFIKPLVDDQNAAAYHVKVQKGVDGDVIYDGLPNIDVLVEPTETQDYLITVTNPDGEETHHLWKMEVCNANIFDGNDPSRRSQPATANFNMNVAPNPSAGIFTLNTATPVNGSLQVVDVTGKQVYQAQLSVESTTYAIDLTNFAAGVYMLIVNSDQGHFESKLVRE